MSSRPGGGEDPKPGLPGAWIYRLGKFRRPMDLCGEATFEDISDKVEAALITDCEALIEELEQNPNTAVYGNGWRDETKEEFATPVFDSRCTFSFRPLALDDRQEHLHKLGFTDIFDVMKDAVRRYGGAGGKDRIAVQGTMDCRNDDLQGNSLGVVLWKIWNANP